MMSLPLATFEFVRSPQPTLIARGFATAAVLMVLVLILFTIARILGGRPGRPPVEAPGHAGAPHQSAKDLQRIEAADASGVDVGRIARRRRIRRPRTDRSSVMNRASALPSRRRRAGRGRSSDRAPIGVGRRAGELPAHLR